MISIKNLSYSHNGNNRGIIENLNLDIKRGEFVTILGKSGCGKTTLANIICGYLKPTIGQIYIDGKLCTFPKKDRVMVNQENDLFNWMTVMENMEIASNDLKLINKYLRMVSLDSKKDVYPDHLSGGMKKKLSLARALSVNPNLLVLDEPFSYLDYSTKIDLFDELHKIIKLTNTTTILITHNIDESLYLSDRVITLRGYPIKITNDIKINRNETKGVENKKLIKIIKSSY